jgi:hypothetical protein
MAARLLLCSANPCLPHGLVWSADEDWTEQDLRRSMLKCSHVAPFNYVTNKASRGTRPQKSMSIAQIDQMEEGKHPGTGTGSSKIDAEISYNQMVDIDAQVRNTLRMHVYIYLHTRTHS